MSTNFREKCDVLGGGIMTTELSLEHLSFAQDVLRWMREEGWKRIRSECTLLPDEWDKLWSHAWYIKRDFGDGPATYYLCQRIVDRGIQDILAYSKQILATQGIHVLQEMAYSNTPWRGWWLRLMDILDTGGLNMGLNAGSACWSQGTLQRLDALVPVAQLCQSEDMLLQLARNRSLTRDEHVWSIYVQYHKNW